MAAYCLLSCSTTISRGQLLRWQGLRSMTTPEIGNVSSLPMPQLETSTKPNETLHIPYRRTGIGTKTRGLSRLANRHRDAELIARAADSSDSRCRCASLFELLA